MAVNMMGLWYAGRLLENRYGGWRFLMLYLTCGIAGGLLQVLVVPGTLLIGASGAVFGLVCAFSALYPRMRITALLFFVIPINLEAKWLGRGLVAFSLLMTVTGLGGQIGHAAHLGGALAGYAWGHFISRGRIFCGL
jgi:membrane associated rhomboid family serine protease